MRPDTWCTHEKLGYSLKFKQVQKRITESHSLVWVKYGETFRNATYSEAHAMRMAEAKQPETTGGLVYYVEGVDKHGNLVLIEKPLFAEIPGVLYEPAQKDQASTRISYALLKQANQFCQAHA